MKLILKKEVKHSVVYETSDEGAPCKSVYVMKEWLLANGAQDVIHAWPKSIELEVKVAA